MSGDMGCDILFIEDDPDDVFLFNRAFEQSRIPCRVHTVNSVEAAEEYLTGAGRYSEREKFPVPNIIVTDLAFRGQSGLEFLNWLRYESGLHHIPVICLSGSDDPGKLEQARKFGAMCVRKTTLFEESIDVLRRLLPAQAGSD
ncbi:MAG TPA: response regulator [Verrucomicrobiae bacterium]|nr:response regulator [Verrucomicrobiae bacterium]